MIKIEPSDRSWLYYNFPDLSVISSQEIRGELAFCASLEDKQKRHIQRYNQYPSDDKRQASGFIEERFLIHSIFPESSVHVTREIGGRIQSHFQKLESAGKAHSLSDMHVFPLSEKICLGHPKVIEMTLQDTPNITTFIEELLVPYFYFHGYWEKYGKKPWEGLSHCLGIATLQQIASDPNNVKLYVKQIQEVFENPLRGVKGEPTPDARKGKKILLRWLENHNRDRSFSRLISQLKKVHLH